MRRLHFAFVVRFYILTRGGGGLVRQPLEQKRGPHGPPEGANRYMEQVSFLRPAQPLIFFHSPQTPLEKWGTFSLFLFNGTNCGQGGGAERSCPCVQDFLISPDAVAMALKWSGRLSEKYLHRQHCLVNLVILYE
jgi:hypothetical protein